MQSDMKEIRNNRKLEEMSAVDLFKSERLDVKSEEDCLSTEQQIESEPVPGSDQQDSKSNVRTFLHTHTINEYPLNSDSLSAKNNDITHHSGHGINPVPKAGKVDFNTEKCSDNTMSIKSTTMSSVKDQSLSTGQQGPTLPPKCPNCSAKYVEPALKAEVKQPPQEVESNEDVITVVEAVVETTDNNILRKYDFIKSYINKRYSEKYEELEKRLNEEPETDANPSTSVPPELETNPAGNGGVLATPLSNMLNEIEDDDVLILESDSDSQESILEVPVSPKPLPPIIQLQDSDEETRFDNRELVCTTEKQLSLQPTSSNPESSGAFGNQLNKQMQWIDNSDDYINVDWAEEDDMVLNCTGVQRGASSIKQIRDMSKLAENDQTCSIISSPPNKSNSNNVTSQFYIDSSRDNSQLQFLSTTNNQDLLMETAIQNTVVPKPGLLSYKQDATLLRKKRPHENDQELSNSTKQKRRSLEPVIEPSTSTANYDSHKESISMFQEPRIPNDGPQGQEHFDIDKVLSGMPRDPRRWAILDEDLMPCPRRQRFWNVRCTICQQDGHIRQNCPTPRKLPSCRICGLAGHIDTRCPDKMCLTCGKKQGTFRKTCESCRILYCNMCKAIGHKLSGCPDLWRRFHQTTHKSEVNVPANPANVMKPPNLLVCCNCTKRGHDSSTCREYRWSQHFATPAFVSSYTDGPQYIYPPPVNVEVNERNTTQQSQEKKSTTKQQKTASTAAATEKSNSSIECTDKEGKTTVLFYTGSYQGSRHRRNEIMTKISKRQRLYNIAGIKEARVKPKFLKALLHIVKFEVKIISDEDGTVVLTVVAHPDHLSKLYDLIRHWLQLDGRDKGNSILTHLPTKKTVMLDLLESKLQELGEYFNPDEVLAEINHARDRLSNCKDAAGRREADKTLFQLQCKLVRLYQTKPIVHNPIQEVNRIICDLRSTKEETVNTTLYLRILLLYNKMFRPYMPPHVEERIAKHQKKNDNTQRFQKFQQQIAMVNESLAKQNKEPIPIRHYTPASFSSSGVPTVQSILHPENEDEFCTGKEAERERRLKGNYTNRVLHETATISNSSSVIQEQFKLASVDQNCDTQEGFAVQHQRSESECNKSPTPTPMNSSPVIPAQEDNISNKKQTQVPQSTGHLKNVPSTADVRLQSDSAQSTTKSTSKSKKKSQTQSNDSASLEKEARVNLAAEHSERSASTANVGLQSDSSQRSTKQTSKSKKKNQTRSNSSASSQKETRTNSATEHLEACASTADAELQSDSSQYFTRQASRNKKKIKALSNESVNLETEARELIQTALEFNVPYITKPAMDIERRLNDKSIQEKHVTVLRKLVKLEKKHQRKVNTVLMK